MEHAVIFKEMPKECVGKLIGNYVVMLTSGATMTQDKFALAITTLLRSL